MSSLLGAQAGVNGTSALLGGTQGLTSAAQNKSGLGEDSFLKLLITQLQNQDPTQPQDPTQQVAELANFSTLQEITNLNTSLTSLLQVTEITQNAALIGKNVTVTDGNGNTNSGVVSSVTMNNGTANVLINGQMYPATTITSVSANTGTNGN